MEKQFCWEICAYFLTKGSLVTKLIATFVSATNIEVGEAEAEENVEMNDMNPDVVNEGITDENEEWEEEKLHTEISEGTNAASVSEDAGIRQFREEDKKEIEVIYQKIQKNYEEGMEL